MTKPFDDLALHDQVYEEFYAANGFSPGEAGRAELKEMFTRWNRDGLDADFYRLKSDFYRRMIAAYESVLRETEASDAPSV